MDKIMIVKPSALFLLIRLLATLFLIETLYGGCFIAYVAIRDTYGIDRGFIYFLWVAQVAKFIATFFVLSDIGTRYLNNRFYIAEHHMLAEKGLVNNKEDVYELHSLRKVTLEQDWLGKRLDYGNLKLVLGARGYGEILYLRAIAAPQRIKEALDARLGVY